MIASSSVPWICSNALLPCPLPAPLQCNTPFRLVSSFSSIAVMIQGCLDRLIASVKGRTPEGLYLVIKYDLTLSLVSEQCSAPSWLQLQWCAVGMCGVAEVNLPSYCRDVTRLGQVEE